jgi:hypothetical protein
MSMQKLIDMISLGLVQAMMKTMAKPLSWKQSVATPVGKEGVKYMTADAVNWIAYLLNKNPTEHLGAQIGHHFLPHIHHVGYKHHCEHWF